MASSVGQGERQKLQSGRAYERAVRALRVLSASNQALVRATEESKLLTDVCQIVVGVGGYRHAWVGYAGNGEGTSLRLVAHAGQDGDCTTGPNSTLAEADLSFGPMSAAIRTGRPAVVRDIAHDESFGQWRREALRSGYVSCIALPLQAGSHCIGGLSVYASEPAAFDEEEVRILTELADDLAFGIATLRAREEHARSDEQMRRTEELYNALVEATGAHVVRVDKDGHYTFVSDSFCKVLGMTREEVIKGEFVEHVDPDGTAGIRDTLRDAFGPHQPKQGLEVRLSLQGQVHVFLSFWKPVRDPMHKIVETQITLIDITEQRRLQQQLYQAQKMESVGRLAGGVAHDFNNVLTAIMGYAELCAATVPADSDAGRYLAEVQAAGKRAATLTRQLLVFSRQQTTESKEVNPNELIANLGKMLRRLVREDVELRFVTIPDVWRVKIDPGRFEQVIVNLVVNASDAMPKGGRLTIETSNVTLDEDYCAHHHGVTPGDYVSISVSDTGLGMTESVKSHLFEPFFTTKPHGTGLGLSTCYGIITQAGGHIWAYSEVGRGTTMKVYLPRVSGGPVAHTEEAHGASQASRAETVLVVEDEPSVRGLVASTLRQESYTVLEAGSGHDALRVCREHSGPIHLFLCDLVLPDMGGVELARQLKSIHPDAEVVLASGYSEHALVHQAILDADTSFIQKPFSRTQLTSTVRRVLDRRAQAAHQRNGDGKHV